MKMIMITYNEAMDLEINELLEKCGVHGYSKMTNTFGKGKTSGTHMGDDIWPGKNNVLFIACEDPSAASVLSGVRALRKTLSHEGVKAFVLPLEEVS